MRLKGDALRYQIGAADTKKDRTKIGKEKAKGDNPLDKGKNLND